MQLWRELLICGLQNEERYHEKIDDQILERIIKDKCYQVLEEIKNIIDDLSLSDKDCFDKIESIIKVLEINNISCDRHDFG